MSRFSTMTAVATRLLSVATLVQAQFVLAAAIVVLSATGSQARMETPEEVERILVFLEAENCEIMRDAMGAKMLSVEGTDFVVESNCADGNSYTFTLDQNFKMIDKKQSKY